MPPRANQSNASLYSAIFFAAVFIAATVAAIIFYLKSEDNRKLYLDAQAEMQEIARGREKADVGKTLPGKSYLGTMSEYLDRLADKIGGVATEDATAEVKFNEIMNSMDSMYQRIQGADFDPNGQTVVRVLELLNQARNAALNLAAEKGDQLKKIQNEFDAAQEAHLESEKQWQQHLEAQKQMVDEAQQKYANLQELIDTKFGEQIGSLTRRFEETRQELNATKDDLLRTKAELNQAEERMRHYMGVIESIKPQPLKEIKAFEPDGQIVSVDPSTGIVILNLGSDDHVYPGLTFSVYNKNAPIPPDGKGKAEVEIFDVEKRISIARIKPESVDPKQSIIAEDPIANLIWDEEEVNTFVVAGQFDINDDGRPDLDGKEKIKQMIEDWGAEVADDVTIETDFVVLGRAPVVPPKPSTADINFDPTAMERYEEAVKSRDFYERVVEKASNFSIPVFDTSRFMHFIGQSQQLGN